MEMNPPQWCTYAWALREHAWRLRQEGLLLREIAARMPASTVTGRDVRTNTVSQHWIARHARVSRNPRYIKWNGG